MVDSAPLPEAIAGKNVVVDAKGQFVYIGRLKNIDGRFLELEDVDVHDNSDTTTPKEIYIMDARKYGIKKNRKSVYIMAEQVVSISPLEDVIEY
ncbi:MAG: hypothetical protein ACYTAN_01070 [Planctomycetota bacterium]|jgi:small nuclear ribonucleoprotein (snRNP)-like protein